MSLFLSGCPLWATALLIIVLPTIVACGALVLIRRQVGLQRLTSNNEVAGFKFAVVGVIYAVLLAFAVVVVWQRYTDAEMAVVQEAGAAAALYRLAAGPEADEVATRQALHLYLDLAIARDWPRMATQQESSQVTLALNVLYTTAVRLAQNSDHSVVALRILNQLDVLTQARRSRLHFAIGIMPAVLWNALILGGILTVGFTFFFGTKNLLAQVLMSGVLSVIVFMGLFVIVTIDHPFTGPVHVDAEPLERVLADFQPEHAPR
jgi:hypothetical protein